MNITIHKTPTEFLAAAGDWLYEREAVNGLMLGLANRLANAEKPAEIPPVMMTVSNGRELEAAAIMTPPRGVVLYAPADDPTEALQALAEELITGDYPVPECIGPKKASDLFVKIWSDRTGCAAVLNMAQRIYELRQVNFPHGVAGSARPAEMKELDLLARWTHEFSVAVGENSDAEANRIAAERVISEGKLLLWVHQGRPVSMSAGHRPTRNGIGIGWVYTPAKFRGNGFASACVAELSQRQLDAGRQFCCLYTDLANPTSNSIYQKIGYKPVADSSQYRFGEK